MAISLYTDFVNNYLVKNGMVGNADNLNKAPDQLKKEIDIVNSSINSTNLNRADAYLAAQDIANMIYDVNGNLTKIRYNTNTDNNYETLTYTSGNLTGIAHYVGAVLKGNTVLSYSAGNLVSCIYTAV